jgi:hypothetical protein
MLSTTPGPTIARSHLVSRAGGTALDSLLSPWVVTPFPTQVDYGIDGDVKLAELLPGALKARVLPVTFQYQLKSTLRRIRTPHTLRVKTSHLTFWLAHNVPTAVFLVQVSRAYRGGVVFVKLIDSTFLTDLESRRPRWRGLRTAPIRFVTADRLRRTEKERLAQAVRNWAPALSPGPA